MTHKGVTLGLRKGCCFIYCYSTLQTGTRKSFGEVLKYIDTIVSNLERPIHTSICIFEGNSINVYGASVWCSSWNTAQVIHIPLLECLAQILVPFPLPPFCCCAPTVNNGPNAWLPTDAGELNWVPAFWLGPYLSHLLQRLGRDPVGAESLFFK